MFVQQSIGSLLWLWVVICLFFTPSSVAEQAPEEFSSYSLIIETGGIGKSLHDRFLAAVSSSKLSDYLQRVSTRPVTLTLSKESTDQAAGLVLTLPFDLEWYKKKSRASRSQAKISDKHKQLRLEPFYGVMQRMIGLQGRFRALLDPSQRGELGAVKMTLALYDDRDGSQVDLPIEWSDSGKLVYPQQLVVISDSAQPETFTADNEQLFNRQGVFTLGASHKAGKPTRWLPVYNFFGVATGVTH